MIEYVHNSEVDMKCAIGQDSHRFSTTADKPLILAGVLIEDHIPFDANSDGDVIYHALVNAISGITSVNILGSVTDRMCASGITDSKYYVTEALKYMENEITHVSFSIEGSTPKLAPYIQTMKENVAKLLDIKIKDVGMTATSGEGLTAFGKGEGIFCTCLLTVI
jgi:2-C-methyl-D-erythritol 2,4-cyclodiphosphate synthase